MARARIDHDRLFKELISTFFLEFLQLFLPAIARLIDPHSIEFLDKELFTDVHAGQRLHPDLVVRARIKGHTSYFIIHLEHQNNPLPDFPLRMFRYFARLAEKHRVPVLPIVVFSHDARRRLPREYRVRFGRMDILRFCYKVIHLRALPWRAYLRHPNPLAAALMAKMNIAPEERPRAKLECLRLLATLRLDPARMRLISGFVDTYLPLNREETLKYEQALDTVLDMKERSAVLNLTTSWKEEGRAEGRAQGRAQGRRQGTLQLVQRLLGRRLGPLDTATSRRVKALPLIRLEQLAVDLLDFKAPADLAAWLERPTRSDRARVRIASSTPARSRKN